MMPGSLVVVLYRKKHPMDDEATTLHPSHFKRGEGEGGKTWVQGVGVSKQRIGLDWIVFFFNLWRMKGGEKERATRPGCKEWACSNKGLDWIGLGCVFLKFWRKKGGEKGRAARPGCKVQVCWAVKKGINIGGGEEYGKEGGMTWVQGVGV